jgi:hypothetical protein
MRLLRAAAFVILGALAVAGTSTLQDRAAAASAPRALATPDQECRVRGARGNVIRSAARRRQFLKLMGYPQGRPGYVVDHIIPLACGGCDLPSNMALLTEAEWRAKTPWERRPCAAWWDGTNARLLQKGRVP